MRALIAPALALLLAVPVGVTAQDIQPVGPMGVLALRDGEAAWPLYSDAPCDTACRAMFAGEQQRKVALWHDAAFFGSAVGWMLVSLLDAQGTDAFVIRGNGALGEANPLVDAVIERTGRAGFYAGQFVASTAVAGLLSWAYVKERNNPKPGGRIALISTMGALTGARTAVVINNQEQAGLVLRRED